MLRVREGHLDDLLVPKECFVVLISNDGRNNPGHEDAGYADGHDLVEEHFTPKAGRGLS